MGLGSLAPGANEITPPLYAPSILSREQILCLAQNGWLPFSLLPETLSQITGLLTHANLFFDEDRNEKLRRYPSLKDNTEAGYYYVESEKEYLTLRYSVHSDTQLEKGAAELWHDVSALLKRILVDLARALNFPLNVWDDFLDGCLTLPHSEKDSTPTLLRIFRYLPNSGFAGEHTDLGLLTLCVGDGSGLQVFGKTNEDDKPTWMDVDGPIILAGRVLRDLTENRVRAGLHRVVENPNGRNSLVFALRPSLRHEVDGTSLRMQGTINLAELWESTRAGRININASKEIREKQRRKVTEGQIKTQASVEDP